MSRETLVTELLNSLGTHELRIQIRILEPSKKRKEYISRKLKKKAKLKNVEHKENLLKRK